MGTSGVLVVSYKKAPVGGRNLMLVSYKITLLRRGYYLLSYIKNLPATSGVLVVSYRNAFEGGLWTQLQRDR